MILVLHLYPMKNKSTLLLVIAVSVLAIIAYYVMKEDEGSGGRKAMSDFAIEQPEKIDKIIITETNKNKAELELIEGEWRVNGKFKARPTNVELLLNTFKTIAVQSSVSKKLKKTTVANMAARHKKVEVFVEGELLKTYYVGSPTKDHYGTYMLLEKEGVKSSEPYVVHIPGFNGFLESRFYTNVDDWKYSGVFVYDPLEIATVKVEHTASEKSSFIINQFNKKVSLSNTDETTIDDFNAALVENYLLLFEKVHYNRVAELSQVQVDSVLKMKPTYQVSVTDIKGNTTQVNFVLKKSDNPTVNAVTGEVKEYDDNHLFGYLEGEKEVYLFQYFALGNMLTNKAYFLQK